MKTGVTDRVAQFRDQYWDRGEPGRDTPPALVSGLYRLWLLGLLLKLLGSSWDVAWHFKWLRDELAPPHLINTIGTVIVVGLTLFHTYTGYGADRPALRLMQWGTGVFLVALPIDLINHRINGLDITSWSGSHALLYLGTAIMLAGALRGWIRLYPESRWRVPGLAALWFFFLENMWFPNQHQEYGVLEIASWDRGDPYAEPILLQFAADQIGRPVDRESIVQFSLPIPDWVYPVWGLIAAALVLVAARRTIGRRWAATAVAGGYVAYRCLIWPLLAGADFPLSAVPLFLVLIGLAVDAAHLGRVPTPVAAVLGSAAVTGLGYGGIWAQQAFDAAPPIFYPSAAATFVVLSVLWTAGDLVARRWEPAARRSLRVGPTPT
ncbi:hypothetical protein FHS29_001077 [Saccharothrix tamanrassetensis]|uniref:Uncharacterized protein n=1 Tax=Saccharothrix tamanrassetensis TaxID=1051531 RepID=A0A841CED0_9PSEU|nr:hypothetical protein [Saccharothrix tamanrassetensis]MBB5954507.1 hypothetical protein [Saccharothrix tamanrassetensis]